MPVIRAADRTTKQGAASTFSGTVFQDEVVVGEDLGTVPPDFRARLHKAGVGGMDVLWFQRDEKDFLPPSAWREDAMAMTTTHDLPTVAGWWSGADIEVRSRLGTLREDEVANRAWDRGLLWQAFVTENTPKLLEMQSVLLMPTPFSALR